MALRHLALAMLGLIAGSAQAAPIPSGVTTGKPYDAVCKSGWTYYQDADRMGRDWCKQFPDNPTSLKEVAFCELARRKVLMNPGRDQCVEGR